MGKFWTQDNNLPIKPIDFRQHNFQTKYQVILNGQSPILYIEQGALEKMRHLVAIAAQEVGWLGVCYRYDSWTFVLKDIFLIGQNVSAVHTTLTEDGLAEFCGEILNQDDGIEIYNNLRFWGHSHANMGTDPSGQDEHQMEVFEHADVPWMIRGIFNKKGKISLTLFLYDKNIIVKDLPWSIVLEESPGIGEEIQRQYNEKVVEDNYIYCNTTKHNTKDHNVQNSLDNNKIPSKDIDEYTPVDQLIKDDNLFDSFSKGGTNKKTKTKKKGGKV